jgi:hypothetical protein
MKLRFRAQLALVPLLFACAAAAHASDPVGTPSASGDQPAKSKKWEVSTVTYIWFTGLKGDMAVITTARPIGLDVPFGDILKHLKIGFMGAAEARHDRLVFLGDLLWANVGGQSKLKIRDVDLLSGELKSTTLLVTGLGGYRVVDRGPVLVDLVAGGRLNHVRERLTLTGPNRTLEGEIKKTWVDPVIAARVTATVAPRVSVSLYGDVGGFGIVSQSTWQLNGTLQYQLSRKLHLSAGWRHYVVDYRTGTFLYDVRQDGPIIGAVVAF